MLRFAWLLMAVAVWGVCHASKAEETLPSNGAEDLIVMPSVLNVKQMIYHPAALEPRTHRVPDWPAFQHQLEESPQFVQLFEKGHKDRDDDDDDDDEGSGKRKHKHRHKSKKEREEEKRKREQRREARNDKLKEKREKRAKQKAIRDREKAMPRPPFTYGAIYNPWAPHSVPPQGAEAFVNMYPTGNGLGNDVDRTTLAQQMSQGLPDLPGNNAADSSSSSSSDDEEDEDDEDLDDDERKERKKERKREKKEKEEKEKEKSQQPQQIGPVLPVYPTLSPYTPSPASFPAPPVDMELRRRWQTRPPPIVASPVPWLPYNLPGHFIPPAYAQST